MAERDPLNEDQPGAPPGFLLDPDDEHTGTHTQGDETGCAEPVPDEDYDQDADPLAQGEGEDDGA